MEHVQERIHHQAVCRLNKHTASHVYYRHRKRARPGRYAHGYNVTRWERTSCRDTASRGLATAPDPTRCPMSRRRRHG